jgi:hypothetical protein
LLVKSKIQIIPTGQDDQADATSPQKPKLAEKPADEKSAETPDAPAAATEDQDALAATALDATTTGPPGFLDGAAPERLHTKPKLKLEPSDEIKKEMAEQEPQTEPEAVPAEEKAGAMPLAQSSVPDESPIAPSDQPGPIPEEEPIDDGADIEPLFNDSGIVVSHHNHHRHSASMTILLLFLILVLAAIGLDIALDLGLLNLPGIPHTNFWIN